MLKVMILKIIDIQEYNVYLEAEIYNGVKIYGFKGTTIVPIHIDTDITLFRFT